MFQTNILALEDLSHLLSCDMKVWWAHISVFLPRIVVGEVLLTHSTELNAIIPKEPWRGGAHQHGNNPKLGEWENGFHKA